MIPAEAAHDTMSALGELGMLQFKDLNADKSAFQRTYASQIKRCDEMARILRFLLDEIQKAGLLTGARLGDRELELDELEVRLFRLESEVIELTANTDRLKRSYNELLELQVVLERATLFFEDARIDARQQEEQDGVAYRGMGNFFFFFSLFEFPINSLLLSLHKKDNMACTFLFIALPFIALPNVFSCHRRRTFLFH